MLMHDRSADTGATFADSTNVEFADDYDRGNLIGLAGDADSRAHLFSHWDEALPHRRLHAASSPHAFEDRSGSLRVTYEHQGETRSLDDYVERNQVAALLVLVDGAVVHDRNRLGADRGTR